MGWRSFGSRLKGSRDVHSMLRTSELLVIPVAKDMSDAAASDETEEEARSDIGKDEVN